MKKHELLERATCEKMFASNNKMKKSKSSFKSGCIILY